MKDTKVKLHIDSNVQPVKQAHRRVPFHVRKQVEDEINNLEQQGIIERVVGPTPWVSPIVVAPRPKDSSRVCICIDMREANKAIQRERHVMPTVDDLIHDLNGAVVFSHLDLRCGYHQLELEEESRYITTFSTHLGLHRYKRLIFGISSASEVFQHVIEQVLSGIQGVRNISDDIIIFGTTQTKHDEALEKVLKRLQDCGLTLNHSKCEFNKPTLEFYGHIFSKKGLSPSPDKVKAIQECQAPTNPKEVRSLLGMATFCSRYIQNYSSLVQPLRELTKQQVTWYWGPDQEKALKNLKDALSYEDSMSYFDPDKATEIFVDASPCGLGAIQVDTDGVRSIVAYASRSLTDSESRYSQLEREALAVFWSIQHFKLYVYGSKFTVVTDHRPLEALYNKANSKPTARVEKWILNLQQYTFSVQYEPGTTNPADFISRHPVITGDKQDTTERYINYIVFHDIPKHISVEEVQLETHKDSSMQAAISIIKDNKWHTIKKMEHLDRDFLNMLAKVKDELSLGLIDTDKPVILRGTRLLLPKSLHQRAIDVAHLGHQGMAKTKALLREKFGSHK